MAAQVQLFSNFSSLNPKPTTLYCDTNFLVCLLFYQDNHISNPAFLAQRDIACFNFYNNVVNNGIELVTSVYGYSELMHYYFFNYTNGMYNVVRNHVRANRTAYSGKNKIHDKYKYFISRYPSDFKTAFSQIAHRIDRVDKFIARLGVTVKYPLPSPRLTNISKNIIEYASLLLESFPPIESNDALHVSIADYLRITDIVSLDDAYKNIDDITVYTYN